MQRSVPYDVLQGWASPEEMKQYLETAQPVEAKILELWLTQPMTIQKWDVNSHFTQLIHLMQSTWAGAYVEKEKYVGALVLKRGYVVSMLMLQEEVIGDFKMYTMWNGCTHPNCRKQGHYSRLIEAAKRLSHDEKHNLVLHVVETNTNAIQLYEKHGFQHVPKIKYREDTICMRWTPKSLQH